VNKAGIIHTLTYQETFVWAEMLVKDNTFVYFECARMAEETVLAR